MRKMLFLLFCKKCSNYFQVHKMTNKEEYFLKKAKFLNFEEIDVLVDIDICKKCKKQKKQKISEL